MKENQLKLPLYPEWDNENKWKTGEIGFTELDLSVKNDDITSFSMNNVPNNIVFTVLGRDILIIDEDGIKWDNDGEMVKVENSEELSFALTVLFEGWMGNQPWGLKDRISNESYDKAIADAIDVISTYPGTQGSNPGKLEVKRALVNRLKKDIKFQDAYESSEILIYTDNDNIHIRSQGISNVLPIKGNESRILQTYVDNIISMARSTDYIIKEGK